MPSAASSWFAAARRPEVAAALDQLFAQVAREIAARGPACWASGRCCNFDAFGHRLYVTGLEAAYTLTRVADRALSPPPSPQNAGVARDSLALPQVPTTVAIAAARAAGGCPFQQGNLCSVHDLKPLACRVYFCDRSAQEWQQDLMERLMGELRALHDRHDIDYCYLEWRDALDALAAAGVPVHTP